MNRNQHSSTSILTQVRSLDSTYWLCILMELLERLAYYGVRIVLPVYLVLASADGGAGLNHSQKGIILAAFGATQTWLPAFLGGLADRYGYKRTIIISVLMKVLGYLVMGLSSDFFGILIGSQMLSAGTGLFKPGVQGTMAHSISRTKAGSMGWGIFYQTVNIGAALSVYVPMLTRDVYGWQSIFLICSAIVAINLILLRYFDEPVDERKKDIDNRTLRLIIKESITDLLMDRRLLVFIILSSGFWFTFHQFFDMLPNYIDDWTNTTILLQWAGDTFGITTWQEQAATGVEIPQERLININALLVTFTMFFFAWISSHMTVLKSSLIGMAIATLAIFPLMYNATPWIIIISIIIFSIGEMLASPKRQEYFANLAPPGKRALYLGYANLPDGIGWVIGSLWAGSAYDRLGDKVTLTRRFLIENASQFSIQLWKKQISEMNEIELQGTGERACEILSLKNIEKSQNCLNIVNELPNIKELIPDLLPRELVIDHAVRAVPFLPDGTPNSHTVLTNYLFDIYQPGQVWTPFFVVGIITVVLMAAFVAWVQLDLKNTIKPTNNRISK